jgi:hypothetical protein
MEFSEVRSYNPRPPRLGSGRIGPYLSPCGPIFPHGRYDRSEDPLQVVATCYGTDFREFSGGRAPS